MASKDLYEIDEAYIQEVVGGEPKSANLESRSVTGISGMAITLLDMPKKLSPSEIDSLREKFGSLGD